jgi:hypothetical protein
MTTGWWVACGPSHHALPAVSSSVPSKTTLPFSHHTYGTKRPDFGDPGLPAKARSSPNAPGAKV